MKWYNVFYFSVVLTSITCKSPKYSEIDGLEDIEFDYRPNILWISVEDIDCSLECYGDSMVKTPNIGRLAKEGVLFENAYSVAGVCSPSRSSVITAMYPTYMGTANHRTYGVDIPSAVRPFTEYLREAGYYCTNNPKEDYNFTTPEEAWDESGFKAHYRHRKNKNQPFFGVYNIMASHESQIWGNAWEHLTVEPDSVRVPLYYPQDNDIIKEDIARKYANIELMDLYVGQKIKMLEDQGILDSTIVVFWSDHGGMLPRQKREAYTSGLKVPFIIRFPNKLLAGTRVDELASLMDLGPTMLSLLGIDKPGYIQAKAIAGKNKEEPRDYIIGLRSRSDAGYDLSRTISDGRYRYMRNYYPEIRVYKFGWYDFQIRTSKELFRLHKLDSLKGYAKDWFKDEKPIEELYDTKNDKDEVINLAEKPEYAKKLNELKSELLKWQQNIPDVCLIPEGEVYAMQDRYKMPVADYLDHNQSYYLKIYNTANWSLNPDKNIEKLLEALKDTIPAVRYWAIRGIGRLGKEGAKYNHALKALENDPCYSVLAALAWAFDRTGNERESKELYNSLLDIEYKDKPDSDQIMYAKLLALNYLVDSKEIALQLREKVKWINENEHYLLLHAAENILKELE